MPKRGPYEKGEAKRAEILRAALRIFAQEGYRGTSLRKVAAACDLSLPGLMHYFDSKEDLLTQVLRARDERARIPSAQHPRLEDYVRIVRDSAATPGLVELFVSLSAAAGDPAHPAHELFARRYDELRAALADRLRHAVDSGTLTTDIPADRLAVLLIALVDGIQLQWLTDRTIDMEQPLHDLLHALGHHPSGAA
jgi:AcrR family transcriptional regulator